MDDLISRQAAIDALGEEPEVWTGKDEYAQGLNNQWHYDVNALKALPSAERRGRWDFNIDDKGWSWDYPYMCDQCGEWTEKEFKFCPNCGVKMEG